jgi:hypothetical protein
MGKNNVKMSNAQVLAAMAGGFVVLAILFITAGMATETSELAAFGGVLMGIGVLAGIIGVGMNAFRR